MRNLKLASLCSVLAFSLLALPAAAADWITTWAASPLPTSGAARGPGPMTLNNQTIRQVLHLSAGGKRLRIRLTNEYGSKPLQLGAATVALVNKDGSIDKKSLRKLTFSGQSAVLIPAEAPMLSDPVDLPVGKFADVSLSLYFPEDTGPCTCHQWGDQDGFVSDTGNFTSTGFTPKQTVESRAFVSGVEVEVDKGKTVVAFGDSITDGVGATKNMNKRWPDVLARRLNAGKQAWGVANEGISGNQVLADGAGQSALARFDRDVLAVPGVAYVIVFEGVNDLGISYGNFKFPGAPANSPPPMPVKATAERLIAGYRQLIARAHAHGIKIYGATIAPYEGAMYWAAEGEAQRKLVNDWIRTSGEFDAVLDFDATWRDPAHPTQMAEGLQRGDHLHGNDAGYEKVGSSIDLKLFR
jgi:lysophospholipase L1-like esterase